MHPYLIPGSVFVLHAVCTSWPLKSTCANGHVHRHIHTVVLATLVGLQGEHFLRFAQRRLGQWCWKSFGEVLFLVHISSATGESRSLDMLYDWLWLLWQNITFLSLPNMTHVHLMQCCPHEPLNRWFLTCGWSI